jgi:hypothetical protein
LAAGSAAEALHIAYLVIADAIDMVFVKAEHGVIDEELPDVLIPIRENAASDVSLVREVKTEILIGGGLEIEEVDALRIEAAGRTGVVAYSTLK